MAWTLEFSDDARRSLKSMDQTMARRIVTFLRERIAESNSPRRLGQALQGKKYEGKWRYRVGDYRIITEFRDSVLVVFVVEVGHRREIYR